MDLLNWCEYICDIMDSAHLTIAYVAERADVSIKTIERIRSLNTDQDIMRATARRIEQVVIGPVTRHICDLDFESGTATEKLALLEAKARRADEAQAVAGDKTQSAEERMRKIKEIFGLN